MTVSHIVAIDDILVYAECKYTFTQYSKLIFLYQSSQTHVLHSSKT